MAGPGARFKGAGRLVVPPAWSAESHRHDCFGAIVVWTGALAARLPGRELTLSPGNVAIWRPGRPHRERVAGTRPCDFSFFLYAASRPPDWECVHDGDGRMRLVTQWLLEEQSSPYVRTQRVLDAHLASFLAEYGKCGAPSAPTIVDAVRAYARERLADRPAVDDLAAVVHMSRAHFIRTYRKLAGHPLMEDVRRLRIEAARDLIVTTDLPLKAIAARAGFADEFHLAHVFRRHLDVPPSYFRRSD